jgi:tryptophan halogenase
MKVEKILIVGGGSAGWMTAATLIKAFPNKEICLIESKDVPIVGVGESTLLHIKRWTDFIGLKEQDFFKETDASVKLSIKFTDFYRKDYGSFHYPFGFPVTDNDRNPFSDWHLKKYYYPDTKLDDFVRCLFASSALFENNKFSDNESNEFENFNPVKDVAYHFDATKFGNWLRDFICVPQGVKHIVSTVNEVITNELGVEKLILSNGTEVDADLYVDCTGWKSLLLGTALNEPFDSYADMLPNNKAWACRVPYKNKSIELEGFTNCTAIENGWCWNIPLWSRIGTGYVYSDKFVTKDQALEEYKKYLMSDKMIIPRTREEVESFEYKEITMRVGIHQNTFVKNVVGIGLAAGFIEPLESNGLFSVHEFLFKLVDILQRDYISQWDRDMYNISVRDVFDKFAKFVMLHYALSHRDDTEYWRSIAKKEFKDKNGDPSSPLSMRTDNLYNLIERYMENWEHPLDMNGIPYIATGMNIKMMNISRISQLEFWHGKNQRTEVDDIISGWEKRKLQWNLLAQNCPTIEEYLGKKYYNDNTVE